MKHRIKPLEQEENELKESLKDEDSSQTCDCKNHTDRTQDDNCDCRDNKNCKESCSCDDECDCGCGHNECKCECNDNEYSKEEEYLNMARVIQADFDNFRKKSYEQMALAKQEGEIQAIEVFLPAIDAFSEAKKVITDEKILAGVEMIEKKIFEALKILGVEKIEAVGKKFDHNYHNAIAVINDNSLDDDVVQTEYQAGYKFKDKVIRYSQVIVNKKEEK